MKRHIKRRGEIICQTGSKKSINFFVNLDSWTPIIFTSSIFWILHIFFSYERVLVTNLWCMYEIFWSKYDFFHELNQYEFSNYWSSSFPVTFFPHALWGQFSAFFIKWSTQCCVWKCSRMWLHQSNFYIISKSCLENHQCSSALYVQKRLVFVICNEFKIIMQPCF